LTEDRYGVVQRDIPRILEALLVFLTALEDAQKEIASSDDADDAARAVDVYSGAADGMTILGSHVFVANGLDSDEGSCRENCTDIRTSVNCLPVSLPCCAKAAGIRRLLLEVQILLVATGGPGFARLLDTHGYLFVYCA
jgi:hypothetical protein